MVRIGYVKDSILTRYRNNEITEEDVRDFGWRGLGFGTSTQRFIEDNLIKIIGLAKELPESYKALIPNLKELKRLIESQRYWKKKSIEISMKNQQDLADSYDWHHNNDSIARQNFTNLVLHDPIYKNKVIFYNRYQLGENIWDASLIRTSAINILWKITQEDPNKTVKVDTFLKGLNLRPMPQLDCDSLPYSIDNELEARFSFIMYNEKDENVIYNYVDSNGRAYDPENYTIEANSFLTGENFLSSDTYIKIFNSENCESIFGRSHEDYIVIE